MSRHDKTRREQRSEARKTHDQSITFSLFNTPQRLFEHSSRMCNLSQAGMCFESFQPLHPGMVLCIMREQLVPAPDGSNLSAWETALAEVRWCRPKDEDVQAFYQIGVRFF